MKYNGVIQRKLAILSDQLLHLKRELEGVSYEQFRQSWAMQRMAERSLQVMVEVVIDIAERIIALHQAGPSSGAADAIGKLQVLGVIADAEPYLPMVKFRNFIVHRYEQVSPDILFSIAAKHLDTFVRFSREIEQT